MPAQLSVLIPCKDEHQNIADCINSVRSIADEIVVADSGSTDGTLDIVHGLGGCRVIQREYVNPADFKNWAAPQCSHDWILAIDADERLTPELATEIRMLLDRGPKHDAYYVFRRNFFFGREVKHCGWERDKVLGLYRRDVCRYAHGYVHEHLEVSTSRIGYLSGKYLHYPYWSFDQYLEKLGRYTTWAAWELHERGNRSTLSALFARPSYSFVRHYILRRGFLDGKMGLIISALASYYVFIKFAKLWSIQHGLHRSDILRDLPYREPPSAARSCQNSAASL